MAVSRRRRVLASILVVLLVALVALRWAPGSSPGVNSELVSPMTHAAEVPAVVGSAPSPRVPRVLEPSPVVPVVSEGAVPPAPLADEGRAFLFGRIAAAAGAEEGTVGLMGCGFRPQAPGHHVDLRDGNFAFDTRSGPCVMRAWRQEGALKIFGPDVYVEPDPNQDVSVELQIPEFRPAGLGILLAEVDAGIRVDRVLQGTPAWEAGLEAGDVIVGIEGEQTVDLDLREFIGVAVGPRGTEVEIEVVGTDGNLDILILERDYLTM